MWRREPKRELKLEIDREANALTLNNGANASWIARRRAEEASSATIARGWRQVAAAIERKNRPSLRAVVFN